MGKIDIESGINNPKPFVVSRSGSVSRDEMQSLLLSITHDVNEMQISRIMKELHADAHEEVSFETFYNWCHDRIRVRVEVQQYCSFF